MDTSTTTPLAEHEAPNLSRVVEEALDAFWDVIADNFPLSEAGDRSLLTTEAFDIAAQKVVEEWVKTNAPAED